MDDRTLLEMAAKAAGIELKAFAIKPADGEGDGFIGYMADPAVWRRGWFEPLTDDGDAFRLAVKLRIDIDFDELNPLVEVYHKTPDKGAVFSVLEAMKPDNPCAAVRWAIVRAAAAIGAALP